ncbi:nucleoside kinase [Acetobacteroides hydrogenigenes]|uniref:Uridine kinase n=1 Tax=Acetobacteroides hydrogenigenes TaxID=979970 RepID=A0A4R2ERU7_9BACT|nr:nucleoside kinase [Acetobacteroides hydrogenigenes]TCN70152.1 uridine kinase [Acetobacteroides hydrogenigenes]
MPNKIEIVLDNIGAKALIEPGMSLLDIAKSHYVTLKHPVLGAFVNNKIKELSYRIYSPKTVRFIDITHQAGRRMYERSLFFVLNKAIKDVLPSKQLRIEHSISKGYYCEIEGMEGVDLEIVMAILDRMKEIIDADLPFNRIKMLTEEAIPLFEAEGLNQKVKLLKTKPKLYTSVYQLDETIDYYYEELVPSTGFLTNFDLVKYFEGMLLMTPKKDNPEKLEDIVLQNKMFDVFQEQKDWLKIIDAETIGDLNQTILEGNGGELIKVAEALHEKKVAQIADLIFNRKEVHLALISGPSSSGKTTFSKRLAVQLRVLGLKPVTISMDNYFVDREHTPKDENGNYDFESIYAVDIKQFNTDLTALMNGDTVAIPSFNFETGQRIYKGHKLKIDNNSIIIVEGIHALNPMLTSMIDEKKKFKIYLSALTSISMDRHNHVPTTDNRLIRRIVRDARYRNYSAFETIKRWPSVRSGEEKNIFPYQEFADVMFNSALLYELAVLKQHAEPLLREVPPTTYEYAEAHRLLKFLSYFVPLLEEEIPPTSILREFLGGSSFSF